MDDLDDLLDLGLTSTLHFHASGALTFCAAGEGLDSGDDFPLLAVEA
jgi:hypothetical protein